MTVSNKIILSSFSLCLIAGAAPALAQAQVDATAQAAAPARPVDFAAGVKVSDTAGGVVGTIASVDGEFVILKTDKHDVRLPKTSFTATDAGFIMAMTQGEVNAAVEAALADAGPILSVGAVVRDTAGAEVGTVQAFDDQFATLKLARSVVRLPVSAFGRGTSGPVIATTAAELEAEAAKAVSPQ